MRHTFRKRERLRLRTDIDELFSAGSKAFSAFPVRAVCRRVRYDGIEVSVLISVPKRHLRHAVERNHVKRRLRESYRLNKEILTTVVQAYNDSCSAEERVSLHVSFLWIADGLYSTEEIETKTIGLLHRIAEKMFPTTLLAQQSSEYKAI